MSNTSSISFENSTVVIDADSGGSGSIWLALTSYRQLLKAMVVRNVKLQFRSKLLAPLWVLAQPLLVTFAFIWLGRVTGANPDLGLPYPLFIFSGLALWNYFSKTTSDVATALRKEQHILKKVYFPRILVPLVPVFSNLVNLIFVFAAILVFGVVFGHYPNWQILLLPIVMVQIMLLVFGLGCIWSGFSLLNEELEQVLGLILYVGVFISPVMYSPAHLSPKLAKIAELNPISGSLMAFRACWFESIPFPTTQFLYASVFSLIVFAFGLRTFRRIETYILDRL